MPTNGFTLLCAALFPDALVVIALPPLWFWLVWVDEFAKGGDGCWLTCPYRKIGDFSLN
jgi:hypothetical protein